jgi:hypothetical protein
VHEGRTGPNGTNYTEPAYDPCAGLGFVETVKCEAKQFFKELAVISGMALPYEYPDLPKYSISELDNTGTGSYSREAQQANDPEPYEFLYEGVGRGISP